jgi:hypothetical protein
MNISQQKSRPQSLGLQRVLALVLMIAIVMGAGIVYGRLSNRWGLPASIDLAVTQIESLPNQIGQWTSIEDVPMGKTEIEMLECAGYANRRYMHQDTKQVIQIAILVGPAGPIAVHTPEICYSSRAFSIQKPRQVVTIEPPQEDINTFWEVEFASQNAFADGLQVLYAWSTGDRWVASESPRFEFAANPYLFKLQMATPLSRRQNEASREAAHDFLQQLCGVWQSPPTAP